MSASFRRIPVKDMPPRTFRRQLAIVIALGAVLIAAAAAFSFWVDTESAMRAAQQRGVHVQMAASRIGQEYWGKSQAFVRSGSTDGTLTDNAQRDVLAAANEQGTVRVTGFDHTSMQATQLTYDDGTYTVTYDASSPHPWTVSAHVFPLVTHSY